MNTRIVEHAQGSPQWHAHRTSHFNASDASAMLGLSSYKTRAGLLHEKATGITPEVDAATQRRFDQGHAFEAIARPWAEEIIGESLYPVVLAEEGDIPLSASLDGLTMAGDIAWEHKTLSLKLAEALDAGAIPEEYFAQMEQGLMLSGASKCLFMASAGDRATLRYAWYAANQELRQTLIAGWRLFAEDMVHYRPVEEAPAVVAAPVEGFGALVLQVEGRVLACNLDAFNAGARAFIDRLPKASELATDQHFANAEAVIKSCAEAELRIKAAKEAAMAQAADIDKVFRAVDLIAEEIRAARLSLEKVVKVRKDSIRVEIMQDAQARLSAHIRILNDRLGGWNGVPLLVVAMGDFATAIKGKKTITSLRDACDSELARAKIAANELACRIEANKKQVDDETLVPDFPQVCAKAPDDFTAMLVLRRQQRAEREAQRLEAERARIQAIEAAEASIAAANAQARIPTASSRQRANPEPSPNAIEARIRAFINSRVWKNGEEHRIRAVLIEYEKFTAQVAA